MRQVSPQLPGLRLRMRERLRDVVDRAARHPHRFQLGDPVVAAAFQHDRRQDADQRFAVGDAQPVGGKARVVAQFRRADRAAIRAVLRFIAGGHDQVAVAGGEHLIGHHVLMRVAGARGRDTGVEVVGVLIGQQRHMAVQQGDVQMLPQAAAMALLQGRQDRDRGVHAGDD
ncbi:hypothetical protein G6F57_020545 [Rhizopus arrhizus]|nr:hypothetical protein G6F57_020545 [Rhizopus arrhizus]